jgi:hypothetical protein
MKAYWGVEVQLHPFYILEKLKGDTDGKELAQYKQKWLNHVSGWKILDTQKNPYR